MQEYSRVTEKMKKKKSLCLVHAFSSCPPLLLSFFFLISTFLYFRLLLAKYFCFSIKARGLPSVSIELFFPLFQYLFSQFAVVVFQVHSSQSCDLPL